MNFEELKAFLESQGYTNVVQCLTTGKVYGLYPFIFTIGLVCGIDQSGYECRYCYMDLNKAVPAIRDWQARGFEGTPSGFIKRK